MKRFIFVASLIALPATADVTSPSGETVEWPYNSRGSFTFLQTDGTPDSANVECMTTKVNDDTQQLEIVAVMENGAPVLVGTASIESSEHLSTILKKRGIEHQVLNAKHHGREAEIIAEDNEVIQLVGIDKRSGRLIILN